MFYWSKEAPEYISHVLGKPKNYNLKEQRSKETKIAFDIGSQMNVLESLLLVSEFHDVLSVVISQHFFSFDYVF